MTLEVSRVVEPSAPPPSFASPSQRRPTTRGSIGRCVGIINPHNFPRHLLGDSSGDKLCNYPTCHVSGNRGCNYLPTGCQGLRLSATARALTCLLLTLLAGFRPFSALLVGGLVPTVSFCLCCPIKPFHGGVDGLSAPSSLSRKSVINARDGFRFSSKSIFKKCISRAAEMTTLLVD